MRFKKFLLSAVLATMAIGTIASAADYSPEAYMQEGLRFERRAQYFQAARYYFQALQRSDEDRQRSLAYAYISNALIANRLPQSATYFFLKALGTGDDQVIRIALHGTKALVDSAGTEIFRKYVLKYTKEDQYPKDQRDYFLYFIAQDHLFNQRPHDVLRAVNDMDSDFLRYPSALFLRGTAELMLGNIEAGINDFKNCARWADKKRYMIGQSKHETQELRNRCTAGVARAYYQGKNYAEAEKWYDDVEIQSMVWPQIQYELAWNSVARGDYNRALGRLVTYKAPGLSWFHDSEVEMLRSVSYLQMCIYDDVEKESKDFMDKYTKVGQDMKGLLDESADGNTKALIRLFQKGIYAMNNKIHSESPMDQVMNRFVRSPYFVQLARSGERVRKEMNYLNSLGDAGRRGLGGMLREVLVWRWQTAQEVGGAFVRDRLATEYKNLLSNVSTIDIVKLEMLRRSRAQVEKLGDALNNGEDVWGHKKRGSLGRPGVRDNQFFWSFNGEFWADELGDYTFALRPECY
jgi:tetratricopeptide (TPR) repeat protein